MMLIGPNGLFKKAQDSKIAGRYSSIQDKVYERNAEIEIATRLKEDIDFDNDIFVNDLITECLIIEGIDYYNVDEERIYLGLQNDGSYLYNIALVNLNDSKSNMALRVYAYNSYIELPISNSNGLLINWDVKGDPDNFIVSNKTYFPTHYYEQTGKTYEVQIKGLAEPGTRFGGKESHDYYEYDYEGYISSIINWGENGFSEFHHLGVGLEGPIPLPSKKSFEKVTSFENTFQCTYIEEIPAELFSNCPRVTTFYCTFSRIKGLTEIPEGLFDNCPNLTDFKWTFSGCDNITSIPVELFYKCSDVTTLKGVFNDCRNITSIPAKLFDKCTNVTSFSSIFDTCKKLTSIPVELFDKCLDVTNFSFTFGYCTNLTGNAPDLWNKDKFPKVTSVSVCFSGCSKLTNFSSIPSAWK